MKIKALLLSGLFLLTTSCAFSAPPITLTDGGGNAFGTPSNPIVVTTSGAINTTSDITTTGNVTANAFVSNGTGTSTINQGLNVYGADNATLPALRVLSNTSVDRVWINGAGNVGIGTTSPNQKMHIMGNIQLGSYNKLSALKSDLTTTIDLIGLNAQEFTQINATGGTGIVFREGADEWMRINSVGKIGIGITNPAAKLVVFASDTTPANNLYVQGAVGGRLIISQPDGGCSSCGVDAAGTTWGCIDVTCP